MLWHQVVAGQLAGIGMGALYGVRYSDMCAYRAIRRDALLKLDMREMTYGWNIEMQMKAARTKLRILEGPAPLPAPRGGVVQGRRVAPRHAAGVLGHLGTTCLRVAASPTPQLLSDDRRSNAQGPPRRMAAEADRPAA